VIRIKDNELYNSGSHEVFVICAKLYSLFTSFPMKISRPKFILISPSGSFYCDPEGEHTMAVESIRRYSPNNTASHPRRLLIFNNTALKPHVVFLFR
jgi:hypothetical protein